MLYSPHDESPGKSDRETESLKALPEDRQAYAAEVIEHIAASDDGILRIPADHLPGVLEGLAEAKRGEFADEQEIDRALRRTWV